MLQSPPRRPSNAAALVVLGFVVSGAALFAIDLVLDFGNLVHSLGEADAVSVCVSLFLYFTVRHYPVRAGLITGYFTNARAVFWIANLLCVAVAAGLTALRVARVRATEPPAGAPPRPFGPPAYGPPAYGPPPYGPPQGPPPGPYGPPTG